MRFYEPPDSDMLEGTVFDPYDPTLGPIMAALQAGRFETAARLTRELADRSGIPERRLVIMQGAPGSGKSTKAREVAATVKDSVVYATDDYWTINSDTYRFDASLLSEAHAWNQRRVELAMEERVDLIAVDNTNILREYAAPYVHLAERFGYRVEFCRVDPGLDECLRRNALRSEDRIIPEDVIVEMYGKMETLGPLRHKIVGEQRVNMGGLLGSTIVLTCSCGKKVNIVDADHFDREVS